MVDQVNVTIFTSRRDPTDTLILVAYAREACGIQHNGLRLDDLHRLNRDIQLAIEAFPAASQGRTKQPVGLDWP